MCFCSPLAAGAVPGEEWAERLRLLEARFEKSEQRAAALKEEYEFQYQLAAGEDADGDERQERAGAEGRARSPSS